MVSLLFTAGGAVVNAFAFSGTNFVFSRLTGHGEEKRKIHDLALEQLQRARHKWNKHRMKRLAVIKKDYVKKNEKRTSINNVDEAMLEYYQVSLILNPKLTSSLTTTPGSANSICHNPAVTPADSSRSVLTHHLLTMRVVLLSK